MGKIVAGIPSNRPELCRKAVDAWKASGQFDEIWVMWDGPEDLTYQVELSMRLEDSGSTRMFIRDPNLPCIPTGSGCCRSRLVLEAWKNPDVEWLVHLDDDVVPMQGAGTWPSAIRVNNENTRWFNTMQSYEDWPRGHPYSERRRFCQPKVVHGVWNGVPDYDAAAQLAWDGIPHTSNETSEPVPHGLYFSMSSMAVAIHRDLFPASYFLWMGKDLPLNKYGDIWCGVILKRICDHFGWFVTSGAPVVYHERASNVWENLRQECKCIEENEHWWEWVDAVDLHLCTTVAQCYRRIAEGMHMPNQPSFKELRGKMLNWINLFN